MASGSAEGDAGVLEGASAAAVESPDIAGELDVLSRELQTLVARFRA